MTVGGRVITRQRPATAGGMCFITLEDETGLANVVVTPDVFERNRPLVVGASGLVVSGQLERRDRVTNLKAQGFELLGDGSEPGIPSRDFH